jgi:protocatechuate 3,4-dioxygenase beta subunit
MTAVTTSAAPRRRLPALPIAVAVLVGLVAALLSPLGASAAVVLSGVVVGPTGTPIPALKVTVVLAADGSTISSATTSSSGAFSLPGLTPGDYTEYTLQFPATGTTFAQYLGGSSTLAGAQVLGLSTGGGNTSYVRAALAASGKVSGKVTTASGAALASASVTLYQADSAGEWLPIKTVTTSTSGSYSFASLEPGDYRLQAKKGTTYPPVYSGGSSTLRAATDVGVVAGVTTTSHFKLGTVAKISGTVRTDAGAALPGVKVTAWRYAGEVDASTDIEELHATTVTTSATGAYTVTGLTPGEYTLYFEAPDGSGYGSTFLGNEAESHQATVIIVGSGASITGKNMTLQPGGSISGSLKREGVSDPIPNVRVSLLGYEDDPDDPLSTPRTTYTGVDGTFTFEGVGPGDYAVVFGAFTVDEGFEDISWARRGWSEIEMTPGLDVTNVHRTTVSRPEYVPNVGTEPEISMQGGVNFWEVGSNLEVSLGTWPSSGYPATGGYQWYRDGELIPGATEYTYSPVPADLGHTLTVELTRYDWSYGPGSYLTAASPTIVTGDAPTRYGDFPTILGSHTVGKVQSVDPSTWEVLDNAGQEPGVDLGILWSFTWQRSTDLNTWTDLETAPTHVATAADLLEGPYLRVSMHGERYGYEDAAWVTTPVSIQMGEFTPVTAASITTTATTWKANPGVWSPAPTAPVYLWSVYDADNQLIETQGGQTLSRAGRSGKLVTLTITLNDDQIEEEVIHLVAQKGPALTTSSSLALTGSARVGEVILAPALDWSPTPTSQTYKWQYYTGTAWKTIAGATANGYQIPATYKGKKLRVVMTASTTNFVTSSRISSSSATVVTGFAPTPIFAPSHINGEVAAGSQVIIDSGIWIPEATSYTYLWRHRDSLMDTTPTTISGATSTSYTIPASLVGKYLEVVVTAKRAGHANGTSTLLLGEVTAGRLVSTVLPIVTKVDATTYHVTKGTWSPAATSSDYKWISITAEGNDSYFGSGDTVDATGSTWDTSNSAAFSPVDVIVTAEKSGWTDGELRIPVKNGTFQLSTVAMVDPGNATAGTAFTSSNPVFNNPPDGHAFAYQWQYKNSTGSWVSISGATAAAYIPSGAYVNKEVRLRVQATATRYATHTSYSDPVTVLIGDPPVPGVVADAPRIDGQPAAIGAKLTVDPGVWNVAGLAFTYQWQHRPDSGSSWVNIAGATTSTFTPSAALFDEEVNVVITAKKAGYQTANAEVAIDAPVTFGQLTNVTKPTVSKSGSTLTVTKGKWNVTPTSYQYRWYRVDAAGAATLVGTEPSYTLVFADSGSYVYAEVIAEKEVHFDGSVIVTGRAGPAILPSSTITIGGDRLVGETLSADVPGWNLDSPTVTYQWTRSGVAIAGATASSYSPVAGDLGKTIAVKIVAKKAGYPSYSGTVSAGKILSQTLPVNVTAPSVAVPGDGIARVGTQLTASPGTWSLPSMTFGYQWYRGTTTINGATAATYTPTVDDLEQDVWVRVTASKSGYTSATAKSEITAVMIGTAPAPSSAIVISLVSGSYQPNAVTWSPVATVTYQWVYSPDGLTWGPLPGASSSSLSTTVAQSGWMIRLHVTAKRPGHETSSIQSNELIVAP